MEDRKPSVKFEYNEPQRVTFAFDGGLEVNTRFGLKTKYTLTDGRELWADQDLSCKINFIEPKRGQSLWITHRSIPVKGKRTRNATSWVVEMNEPGVIQRNGYHHAPPDTEAISREMGIDESDLERDMRQTHEVIQQKAADRVQARENVARMPEPPAQEPPVDRKPPQMADEPTPPPVEPEAPKAAERYIWMPNLVEVARSYSFKLNVGNYESRDFFCSQKAECRPEDADVVSAKLYEFCKAQVMKAVAAETGRKTA